MKVIIVMLCAVVLALFDSVQAKQPTKVPHIGYLSGASYSANSALVAALRQGLREHGYTEVKNILIEYRYADDHIWANSFDYASQVSPGSVSGPVRHRVKP